jgi:uncharacterized membrane protein YkoI
MERTRRLIIIAAATTALAAAGAGTAIAVSGGDDADGDRQATGAGADRARAAALAITGGIANAVERDSEDGATWEVEVTKPNGDTVDVRLDAAYQVVVVEGDSESADTNESD